MPPWLPPFRLLSHLTDCRLDETQTRQPFSTDGGTTISRAALALERELRGKGIKNGPDRNFTPTINPLASGHQFARYSPTHRCSN